MTFDEALSELGIDPSVGAEGARKAYLRLLKKRKPEVDPEGFMRLREAYELARVYLPSAAVLRAVEEQAEGAGPERIRLETPAGIVWLETQSHGPDKPFEEPAEEPARNAEPLPIAEPSPEAEPIPTAESDPIAEPFPEAGPLPIALSAIETASAPDSAPPLAPSIEELISSGKLKKAASHTAKALREATVTADIGPSVPMPRTTLRLLLLLHQKERLAEAATLEKEFAAWLHSTGASARLVSGHLAVWWTLARELSALPKSFPTELRQAVARAALDGDLSKARFEASEYRFEQPLLAQSAAMDLRRYAPSLATFMADVLAPPQARVEQPNAGKGVWLIVPILLAVVRIFSALDRTSTPTSYESRFPLPTYTAPPPRTTPAQWEGGKPRNIWELVDSSAYVPLIPTKTQDQLLTLAATIEEAAENFKATDEHQLALRVQNVRTAIEMGDCSDAQAEMIGLVAETERLKSASRVKLKPMVTKLDRMLTTACEKAMADLRTRDGGAD